MEAYKVGKYLAVPFKYGKDNVVTLFIPESFIDGSEPAKLVTPDNLFGINLKAIWEDSKTKYWTSDEG